MVWKRECADPLPWAAAQQIEGATSTDGRGESIWDRFAKQQKDKVQDGSNGDVVSGGTTTP